MRSFGKDSDSAEVRDIEQEAASTRESEMCVSDYSEEDYTCRYLTSKVLSQDDTLELPSTQPELANKQENQSNVESKLVKYSEMLKQQKESLLGVRREMQRRQVKSRILKAGIECQRDF